MKLINLFWGILRKNIHFWNKEILLRFTNSIYLRTISKRGLMASRPGSRRRAEAGSVEGCAVAAFGPKLYQGLSPQGSFWISTCIIHLIVWGGNHFSLWRVLEHLASTVFCGKLTPLKPDHSLARRSLPRRQAFSSEPQLDPHSLFYRLMKQPEVSSLSWMCGIFWWFDDVTLEDYPERVHDDLVVWLERLRALAWRSMEANVSYATRQCVQYSLSR